MTFPYNGYYIHINLLFDQKTNIFLIITAIIINKHIIGQLIKFAENIKEIKSYSYVNSNN